MQTNTQSEDTGQDRFVGGIVWAMDQQGEEAGLDDEDTQDREDSRREDLLVLSNAFDVLSASEGY